MCSLPRIQIKMTAFFWFGFGWKTGHESREKTHMQYFFFDKVLSVNYFSMYCMIVIAVSELDAEPWFRCNAREKNDVMMGKVDINSIGICEFGKQKFNKRRRRRFINLIWILKFSSRQKSTAKAWYMHIFHHRQPLDKVIICLMSEEKAASPIPSGHYEKHFAYIYFYI